jgi:hypothetical protein
MKVKITTKFSLDPADTHGKKNLDLFTSSAGLRSQIEIVSITNNKKEWEVILFLERPEYWGDELEHLHGDLESTLIFHKGKPTLAGPLLTFEQIPINNTNGTTD